MKRRPRFKVGDTVFYPSAGVGVIEAMEDVFFSGKCDPCFVIRMKGSDMTVKIPQTNVEKTGVRPLLNGRQIKDLYKILAAKGRQRVTGGNWAERCKDLERRINSGSCLELGEVVRDLMRWKKQSGLSFEESMLLETASGYLASELAAVQGIPPEAAIDRIRNHVGIPN